MSICATIGCPIIVDMDACIHDGFVLFDNLSEAVEPEYLRFFLAEATQQFARQGQKGTQGNLNTTIVKQTPIPLPPPRVQSRIVTVLNRVDAAIEATRAAVIQTGRVKVALLQDLLTNGVPGRHIDYTSVKRIGRIPSAWSETRIEQAASVTQGIAVGPERVARKNPTPYLRVGNVHQGFVDLDEIKYIETSGNDKDRYALKLDDVLIVEGHANIEELGRAALVPTEAVGMVFQNHLFRVRADRSKLDPRFLALWINSSPGRAYFRIFGGTTSGLNTVGSTQIRTLKIPLPSLEEQREICDLITSAEDTVRRSQQKVDQLEAVRSALSQGLLTGRIPVKAGA